VARFPEAAEIVTHACTCGQRYFLCLQGNLDTVHYYLPGSEMETLVQLLGHPSRSSRPAVILPTTTTSTMDKSDTPPVATSTYGQLAEEVSRARDVLYAGGIVMGDVVSMALSNGFEFVVCWLAATTARAIAAPLNPDYRVVLLSSFPFPPSRLVV